MEVKKRKERVVAESKAREVRWEKQQERNVMEPKKRGFTKKVPILLVAGEVWLKTYLEGSDFTGDFG